MKLTFTEWCSALKHDTTVKDNGVSVNVRYYVKLKSQGKLSDDDFNYLKSLLLEP